MLALPRHQKTKDTLKGAGSSRSAIIPGSQTIPRVFKFDSKAKNAENEISMRGKKRRNGMVII